MWSRSGAGHRSYLTSTFNRPFHKLCCRLIGLNLYLAITMLDGPSPIGIIPCGVGHSLPHPWPRPPKYSHHPKYTMKKIRCRSHRRHASPSIQWYQQRPTRNGPCIHFQHAGIPTISGLVCLKLASATPSSPPRRQSIAPGLGPVWFEANRQPFR